LGGSLAPPLPLPRPPSRLVVAVLPGVIVPRASQESTPRCFQNWSHFRAPFFVVFRKFWNPFSLLFLSFFALGGDLGEAAFLKDFPSKIADFKGPGVQEPFRKGVPKRVQKRTPKKTRTLHFRGTILASLGVSWATFGAVLGHLVAAWPPLGPRGSKRDAQKQPKRIQKSTG
jgi:hypothetical protein